MRKTNEQLKLVPVVDINNREHVEGASEQQTTEAAKVESNSASTNTSNISSGKKSDNVKLLAGRYELISVLGRGNICNNYKSIDRNKSTPDHDHFVTVKVLKRVFHSNQDWVVFKSELSRYHELDHTNISHVTSLHRSGSTAYLLIEYLSGESLGQTIRSLDEKQMPVNKALNIVKQIGLALSHAHNKGLVHGDLKPANVFLTDKDEVKVMDFGLAHTLRITARDKTDAPHYVPNNYSVSTPAYASPELLAEREPEPADDVYALACITYELLTGKHPFGRVRASGAQEFGLKLKYSDALTEAQWSSLQQAMTFDHNKRTSTVTEFLTGLEETEPGPSSRWIRWLVIFGLLASAVFFLVSGMLNDPG